MYRYWNWPEALAIGIGLTAGILLAANDSRAQSPTPLGEIKRQPYTASQPATMTRQPYVPTPIAQPPLLVPVQQQIRKQVVRQNQPVPCWYAYITPETYTLNCANGYWFTQMADGTTAHGMGVSDPNAIARGSNIVINPATGGPSLKGDATVIGPPGQPQLENPSQGPMYGYYPLQTR